jgi:hypothetical protein
MVHRKLLFDRSALFTAHCPLSVSERVIDSMSGDIKSVALNERLLTYVLPFSAMSDATAANPAYRAVDDALRLGETKGTSLQWWNTTKGVIVSRSHSFE